MSERPGTTRLSAPPIFELPALSDPASGVIARPPTTRDRQRAYWDTEDLRLARAGVLLAHRDDVWSVELPPTTKGDSTSVSLVFEGEPEAPPAEALDLVRAIARDAPLQPVARLCTHETAFPLESAPGIPLGTLLDEQVEYLDGARVVGTSRELEVVLANGAATEPISGILDRLRAAGASSADPVSPVVRALGSRATAPPEVSAPTAGPGADAAKLLRAALSASAAKLIAHDPGIRRGVDPEDVHQARVATRRLRSHLRAFGDFVDWQWAGELRTELGWLGDALGAVRDADVLLDSLEGYLARLGGGERDGAAVLFERLQAEHASGRATLLEVLRSARYVELLDRLVVAARRPRLLLRIDDDEREERREIVRRPWRRLVGAVEALPAEPGDLADEDLHRVRLLTKRARYATEAMEPVLGKSARSALAALTDAQEVLGRHNDAVVAAAWLREAATRVGDATSAFTAGELAAVATDIARQARTEWPRSWRRVRRKRPAAWM